MCRPHGVVPVSGPQCLHGLPSFLRAFCNHAGAHQKQRTDRSSFSDRSDSNMDDMMTMMTEEKVVNTELNDTENAPNFIENAPNSVEMAPNSGFHHAISRRLQNLSPDLARSLQNLSPDGRGEQEETNVRPAPAHFQFVQDTQVGL